MTSFGRHDAPRFEHGLRAFLEEEAQLDRPDYLADILVRSAASGQRPAWTFPERWLPMVDIARQPAIPSRVPWRPIAVALVLIALLAAAVWVLIPGMRRPLPAPYGRAETGLVAYASGGDIYTADLTSGTSTAVIGGPETDLNPRWSRDGTRLAFERKVTGASGPGHLYVANADGSGLARVTPDPLKAIADFSFSPDGTALLISADNPGPVALIAAVDGSGVRNPLDGHAIAATNAAWRPPDGREIVFMGPGNPGDGWRSIGAVSRDGGAPRVLALPRTGCCIGHARSSPDGSMITYVEWDSAPVITARTHVMAADGSWDRVLPLPPGARWQAGFAWSNDSTRLLVIRGYGDSTDQAVPAVVPVDGSGTGIDIDAGGETQGDCCMAWEWAPDDSLILGTLTNASGVFTKQLLLDPATGTSRSVPWESVSRPTWQRR